MAPKVASSVVRTGPKDSLVAVDAYAPTPAATGAGNLSKSAEITNNAENLVSKISIKPADVSKIIKFDKGEASIDQGKLGKALWSNTMKNMRKDGSIGKKLNSAAGQSLDSIPGISKDMKMVAESLFPGILSSDSISLVDSLGDVVKLGSEADPNSAVGLAKLASKLTNSDLLKGWVDNSAALSLAGGILDQAMKLGIPSIIDEIIKNYKRDKNLLDRLLKSVRSVIFRSDIPTLNIILDHIGSEGVLNQVPDACAVLLGVYRFPKATKAKDWPKAKTELLAVLARINPTWDKVTRNGVEVSNLAPFTRISSNAKSLLLGDPLYQVPVMIAGSYTSKDLPGLAKRNFPKLRA